MNLAFGTLLIFILLFPGFSFRSAYLGGPYTRKASATSFIDELIWSLAPAFVLQFLGYFFVESVLGQNISERAIYHLLTASPQVDFAIIENSLPGFFLYQVVIFGVAIAAGRGLKHLVLTNNLDCKYHFLRVHNDWYYLLTGKILDFEDWPGEAADVAAVQVDLVVEGKEHTYTRVCWPNSICRKTKVSTGYAFRKCTVVRSLATVRNKTLRVSQLSNLTTGTIGCRATCS